MTCLCSQTFIAQDLSCSRYSFVLPVQWSLVASCLRAARPLSSLRSWVSRDAHGRRPRPMRGQDGCVATARNLSSIWHFLPLAPARACELGVRMRVSGSGQACGGAARRGGRGQWFSAGLRRRPEEVRDTSRGDRGFARSRGTGSKAQWVRALRRAPAIRRRHHPHKDSPRAQAFGLQAQGARLASASRPAWALEKLSRRDDIGPAGTFAAPHQ
jgi:hypothetical protein